MTDLVIAAGGSVLMSEVPGIPGCEHIVASRAVSREAGEQILGMVDELRASASELDALMERTSAALARATY